MILNKRELEERDYLEKVKYVISSLIDKTEDDIKDYSREVKEIKDYLWENKADMDHVEKVSSRESITQRALTAQASVSKIKRLRKLIASPYFGRIDFKQDGDNNYIPHYIGIHSFFDPFINENIIFDWRAPLSSMYYDFETGRANYIAPNGMVEGDISIKRQYRIREGKLEFMLESSLSIHDDILQKELSKSSDEKMKNIVATIQRDQNLIIRNEDSKVLIIQGAAGSGKTSIALHRIAFLLYRQKENLTSDDILIISPNRIFADYISNVLPELGEENIPETGMADLASDILENKYAFTSFFEQIATIIDNQDREFIERTRFKSSPSFLSSLNSFFVHLENTHFQFRDIEYGRFFIPAFLIEEKFKLHSRLPILKRYKAAAGDICTAIEKEYKTDLNSSDLNKITSLLKKMSKRNNLISVYQEFYFWLNKPELFKKKSRTLFEYSDIFPLAYIKIFLEGISVRKSVKHLLIDEMQDYTPVQYALISKMYHCNKTILGDINQSLDPESSANADIISKVFPGADVMSLSKSYRSTFEITNFAQNISFNENLTPIERHGKEPSVKLYNTEADQINEIELYIQEFIENKYNSMGIICKTQKEADKLFQSLNQKEGKYLSKKGEKKILLLTDQTVSFVNGIIITNAHLSKGLEFDYVVVPNVSNENYNTSIDRKMLYIACTRAMHILRITALKTISDFVTK
ncbi:MAG: AAA family ATPase [Bacteroidales bacterium]|nr:AAA family ATPase [Bacteroidales bacterium]